MPAATPKRHGKRVAARAPRFRPEIDASAGRYQVCLRFPARRRGWRKNCSLPRSHGMPTGWPKLDGQPAGRRFSFPLHVARRISLQLSTKTEDFLEVSNAAADGTRRDRCGLAGPGSGNRAPRPPFFSQLRDGSCKTSALLAGGGGTRGEGGGGGGRPGQ